MYLFVTLSDSLKILFSFSSLEFGLSKGRPDTKVKTTIKSITKYIQ